MKELTAGELLVELRCLRAHLEPVLNSRMKNVLTEAERRLTGNSNNQENFNSKKGKPVNKMSRDQILNKWLNKY